MKAGTSIITLPLGSVGRPDAGHGQQQLRRIELGVGLERKHRQPRGGDGAIAVDERRIAQGHLAEDRVSHLASRALVR
jgi:hypothetical protein